MSAEDGAQFVEEVEADCLEMDEELEQRGEQIKGGRLDGEYILYGVYDHRQRRTCLGRRCRCDALFDMRCEGLREGTIDAEE